MNVTWPLEFVLADDGLIEPVIVEEVAGNPYARERNARFVLHYQLGLCLVGPLIATVREGLSLHLDTGHLDAIAGAGLTRNQFHQPSGLADDHPGQDLSLAFIGPTVVRALPA